MFQNHDLIPVIRKKIRMEFGENITEKQIEEILNKYWVTVLNSLNNTTSATISLNYLGSFNSRYNVLKLEIRKLIIKIREMEESELKQFYKRRLRNMWQIKQIFDHKNLKIKEKNERRNKSIDECKE